MAVEFDSLLFLGYLYYRVHEGNNGLIITVTILFIMCALYVSIIVNNGSKGPICNFDCRIEFYACSSSGSIFLYRLNICWHTHFARKASCSLNLGKTCFDWLIDRVCLPKLCTFKSQGHKLKFLGKLYRYKPANISQSEVP